MKILLILFCFIHSVSAQTDSIPDTLKTIPKIILVPYQPFMYFSDADQDISRFSGKDERTVRSTMLNNLEVAVYHKLLAHFDAISLMRSTSLNGEEDLRRMYASTGYALYRSKKEDPKPEQTDRVKNLIKSLNKKSKENPFSVTDSSVMLANIPNDEIFRYFFNKYHEKYVLFITQFEINTDNKNMIEWTKQQYERVYLLHYNLFDHTGKLIRAETIQMSGKNENRIDDINKKYLDQLAEKLVQIIIASNH